MSGYTQFPCDLDYWYQNTLGMVKALKPNGTSVFVVFNRSTNPLKKSIGSSVKPSLKDIPNVVKSWPGSCAVYIIRNEVQFQEYNDGSIIFFPNSFSVPSKSPLGRPATAT
jgi:hypothetical protein